MAIVVNQAPADIAFSRNPIVYDLQANDVVETAGVAAINTISFTSGVAATTVISVRYNGQEVRFVGAAVPDASGNQIPLSASPDSSYVASLIPYFQNNYYLDPDFVVTSSGTNLILTAKKKGTAYNLLAGSYQSGAIAQTTAGVDEVRKKNHSIYVEINIVDDADNLTKIYGQPYETDTDGRAKVEGHTHICGPGKGESGFFGHIGYPAHDRVERQKAEEGSQGQADGGRGCGRFIRGWRAMADGGRGWRDCLPQK